MWTVAKHKTRRVKGDESRGKEEISLSYKTLKVVPLVDSLGGGGGGGGSPL